MMSQYQGALVIALMANFHSAWPISKRRTSGVCYPMQATSLLHSSTAILLTSIAYPTSKFARSGFPGYKSLSRKRTRRLSQKLTRFLTPSFRATRRHSRMCFPRFSSNITLTTRLAPSIMRMSTRCSCLRYSCLDLRDLTWWIWRRKRAMVGTTSDVGQPLKYVAFRSCYGRIPSKVAEAELDFVFSE